MPSQSSKVSRDCAQCGTTFWRYPSVMTPSRRFCSLACKYIADTGIPRPARQTRVILSCQQCGAQFTNEPNELARPGRGQFCTRACADFAKIGRPGSRWYGARTIDAYGYVQISVTGEGQVFEHRHIMEVALGRKLADDEDVHHLNSLRDDNHLENLVVMSRTEHKELHAARRERLANGRFA